MFIVLPEKHLPYHIENKNVALVHQKLHYGTFTTLFIHTLQVLDCAVTLHDKTFMHFPREGVLKLFFDGVCGTKSETPTHKYFSTSRNG